MPARDRLHDAVKNALVRDGWTITHDPLRLTSGRRSLYVDLGAERLLAAEKGAIRIAVEIKTFSGPSDMDALEQAIGQHVLYRALLGSQDPGRLLFLAVPDDVWNTLFQEPIGEAALAHALDRVICFDPAEERIVQWTPPLRGET
jgi:hypothetical protein